MGTEARIAQIVSADRTSEDSASAPTLSQLSPCPYVMDIWNPIVGEPLRSKMSAECVHQNSCAETHHIGSW